MKINNLSPDYMKGLNDGIQHVMKTACADFARRFEDLQKTKGIGPATIKKVAEAMNLPLEEEKK
ncbi:hypothetical protein [Halalkalibacter krulwichiae]|uniref:Uncharacterized protein n=1 Tax=Halalkalibacter krulwichiae TaxID=199441 RepID=A0A1X9MFC7_9BACI|nr:hypothetical protein [Halalkalibacter krulwichiae]ARK32155.1 hypothetical protein BkAM31D_21180 [Halalkalibacter krulwichiae]